MQENCTSGLPSGGWKREGILSVRQPVYAPVVDSTEDSVFRGNLAKQVDPSSEKRGPPRAEEDGPRCDARFSSDAE